MLGIRFCGCGYEQVPVSFVCFGTKPTQRACAWDLRDRKKTIRRRRPEEDEGRHVPRVNRRKQWTELASQQERAVDRSLGKPTVTERRLLGPMDPEAGLANVRGWVKVPGGFVGIPLDYTLTIAHRFTESYSKMSQNSPFLRLELTQIRVCLFSFPPPSRLCMLCFVY